MVVELSRTVVWEPSEDTVDSKRPDVVMELPGTVVEKSQKRLWVQIDQMW